MLKLSLQSFEGLYKAYLRVLKTVLNDANLPGDKFNISGSAFASSMREAVQDYQMLTTRRAFGHGISCGKWAGAFVFRLVRNNVLTPTGDVCEDKAALSIPVNTALSFGLEFVGLCPNKLPPALWRELRYYIAKRHINQEALGIIFDTMAYAPIIASKLS